MQNYAPRIDEPLSITTLLGAPAIQRAFRFIDEMRGELDQELVRICEIPAPPFKEQARAGLKRSAWNASDRTSRAMSSPIVRDSRLSLA
jgi:hypothetical protein